VRRAEDAAYDLKLLERDDDPFSLWDAVQRLALAALLAAYRGDEPDIAPLGEALGRIAGDDGTEAAFRAHVIQLPQRVTMIERIGTDVDPDAVDRAHRTVSARLGALMAGPLGSLRTAPRPADDDVSPAAAGRRALRNAALQLLTMAGEHQAAAAQAEAAGTMTDRLAALGALVAARADAAEEALSIFQEAYAAEPLALDKYFGLQALRSDDGALERVRGLMDHPGFSLANPNRVRSLVGAFTQNVTVFHAADGSGYRLVADVVTALDKTNPQVAARLLTAFGDHRRFEARRREAARAVLDDVAGAARSSDVADIARRLLGS
jgi:aminopeptidase N